MQDSLYNIAFERSILNSIIFEPKLFEELQPLLHTDDFYLPAHQDIFNSMTTLTQKNLPIDEEFMKKELLMIKKFDDCVMIEVMSANPIYDTKSYCEEVKELSNKRKLLNITTAIKRGVIEENLTVDEVLSNILNEIKLIEDNDSSDIEVQDLDDAIIDLDSMPIKPKYETGINVIDTRFGGGLELAQLIMTGGEKGSGKTAFTLQWLYNVSQGFKGAYLSFEMPKYKLAMRAKRANLNINQRKNIKIIDKGRDISQIEKTIKKLARSGTKFFTIDSLMKITNKYLKEKRNEQISDITARLSRLCIELDIIIILIVQVSKEDLKSGFMAVKGSGDADHDADIMFFIQKDKNIEKKRNFICEKNRQNGNEFKEEMYINPKTVMLQEHAPSLYEIAYTSSASNEPKKIEMPELK